MADVLTLPSRRPRVFAIPPGVSLASALAAGLRARMTPEPAAMAQVSLLLDTRRAGREVVAALEAGTTATFLPRILALADGGSDLPGAARALAGLPPAVSPMRRWLTLTRLVAQWLKSRPERGSEAAAPALALSLAQLLDELQAAGLGLDAVTATVPVEHAAHWQSTQAFLSVLDTLWPGILAEDEGNALDPAAQRRRGVEVLIAAWQRDSDPGAVVAAGSPGAAQTSAMLMAAVAQLPQGAAVLPGFDPVVAEAVWAGIGPEHPYAGFRALLDSLDMAPHDVEPWDPARPDEAARPFLVAQALRPAPVTDGWLALRPAIAKAAPAATAGLSLIEAPDPRREATAIAMVLREAAEQPDRRAALVTPDRNLARRVVATLRRWGIEADDSAGRPLSLTPPGVFLRLLAEAAFTPFDPVVLLSLLKHPLAGAGDGRGDHLAAVRILEMDVLRGRPEIATLQAVQAVLANHAGPVAPCLAALETLMVLQATAGRPLADMAVQHRLAAEGLAGPALWAQEAGEVAERLTACFSDAADTYGPCPAAAYTPLFATAMDAETVPAAAIRADPRIAIWGTLEARMQSADLVVLGGLVEGQWPAAPSPDPWLSRPMRRDAGLPTPEALIGLDALDFQQAICAPNVVLTRPLRAEGAPTTASRWLARLCTLLDGTAAESLEAMRARGQRWLDLVEHLERPRTTTPPATRPRPTPPVAARPKQLAATEIETLIRDPYALYARRVLDLKALKPLSLDIDARLRGEVLHKALELFTKNTAGALPPEPMAALRVALDTAMARTPLPVALRRLWQSRLARLAPVFLADEANRRCNGQPVAFEQSGKREGAGFTLIGRADRIDLRHDGRLAIYDYKTGHIPTDAEVGAFAKQMPLMAAIAETGGFEELDPAPVAELAHISLSSGKAGGTTRPLKDDPTDLAAKAWAGLERLFASFADPAIGYLARARPQRLRYASDYDHLSRLGEWTDGADD